MHRQKLLQARGLHADARVEMTMSGMLTALNHQGRILMLGMCLIKKAMCGHFLPGLQTYEPLLDYCASAIHLVYYIFWLRVKRLLDQTEASVFLRLGQSHRV